MHDDLKRRFTYDQLVELQDELAAAYAAGGKDPAVLDLLEKACEQMKYILYLEERLEAVDSVLALIKKQPRGELN